MNDFFKFLSVIASIISIATFIYTVFVKNDLINFKRQVLFNTRIRPLLFDLKKANKKLFQIQSDILKQKIELKEVYWQIFGLLSDISPKLPQELQLEVKKVKNLFYKKRVIFYSNHKPEIKWYNFKTLLMNQNDLENLYTQIITLISRIENTKKDNEIIR